MPDPTGRISHVPDFHRGVSWKQPCRVATTANITISTALNAGDTIDGVTLAAGDRVLVKNQSTGSQNGIYLAGVTPARDFDMDQDSSTSVPAEEVLGAVVYVIAGTTNGGTLWRTTNTTAPTLGSTTISWTQIGSTAASSITVADSAGYFTGSDVEAVLAELGAEVVGYQAHGNLGSTETFSAVTAGWHSGTLDANCTFTFTAKASGLQSIMLLELTQDGTGGRTITWPGSVVTSPNTGIVTTAGTTSRFVATSRDGGTTWYVDPIGTGGSALTVKDEGSTLSAAVTSIDFGGAGVTATGTAAVTVTIPGVTAAALTALGVVGEILISDTPSTPLVFADLIQNEAQDDLVYADL